MIVLPFSFVVSLWQAFVLSKIWVWFVVTSFSSAPRFGVMRLYGLCLVIEMFRFRADTSKADTDDEWKRRVWSSIGQRLMYPLVTLGFGWVAHAIMVR